MVGYSAGKCYKLHCPLAWQLNTVLKALHHAMLNTNTDDIGMAVAPHQGPS